MLILSGSLENSGCQFNNSIGFIEQVSYLEQKRELGKLAIAQFIVLILNSVLEQIGGNQVQAS